MQIEAEELAEHGIRPTSVRILVMRAIMQRKGAFCLYDIEADVPTLDRSSIFRALRLFTQHHLTHQIFHQIEIIQPDVHHRHHVRGGGGTHQIPQ